MSLIFWLLLFVCLSFIVMAVSLVYLCQMCCTSLIAVVNSSRSCYLCNYQEAAYMFDQSVLLTYFKLDLLRYVFSITQLETRIVPIKEHTANILIILNNMVLVTKYDSNSYLVLSVGDDHGIKGDNTNGSTPLRRPG